MKGRHNNKPTHAIKKVQFYSLFFENVPHMAFFWQQVDKQNLPDPQLSLFQGNMQIHNLGKMLCKNEDSDTWEQYLFELMPDKLYRKSLNNHGGDYTEFCYLYACFVKKYNH